MNNYSISYLVRQLRHKLKRLKLTKKTRTNCSDPIFITGNQKSGTSAIVSLLGMATEKSYIVDIFFRMGLYEHNLLNNKKMFNDLLLDGGVYFDKEIIKEPDFIFFIKEITANFPNSPIVFIIRDPFSNIRSILNRLNMSPEVAQNTKSVKGFIIKNNPLWNLLFDKRMPYTGGNFFEMLVNRWLFAIKEIEKIPQDKAVVVKYEDFLEDKLKFITLLAENLNISITKDVTAKLDFSFQPRGTLVTKEEFFSPKQINYIYNKCAKEMSDYGYNK
jgi:hypothetical protein